LPIKDFSFGIHSEFFEKCFTRKIFKHKIIESGKDIYIDYYNTLKRRVG